MDSALGQHFDPETMTAILNVLYNGSFYTGEEDGGSAGGISGMGSGLGQRENQYIWSMTEYAGKLFVGTFDTSEGAHFETITTNGFEDPYNHGLRVFAETDSGLCIGTTNPFYGTQLWNMREISTGAAIFSSNLDMNFHWQITQYQVAAPVSTRVFDFTMTPV